MSAPYGKGIHSTDGLVVTGGTYAVAAADDGLSGKDCVKIAEGDLTIEAGADGIKSANDEDEGEMVGATETPEVKAIPGLAREQVIAEVALAGQVGQTAREEEKAKTPWVELEEAEERAMELREQKANLNAVVLFVVMLALMLRTISSLRSEGNTLK